MNWNEPELTTAANLAFLAPSFSHCPMAFRKAWETKLRSSFVWGQHPLLAPTHHLIRQDPLFVFERTIDPAAEHLAADIMPVELRGGATRFAGSVALPMSLAPASRAGEWKLPLQVDPSSSSPDLGRWGIPRGR